ncbi:hypothetical protein ACOMHN_059586 [Nucella lapillus]
MPSPPSVKPHASSYITSNHPTTTTTTPSSSSILPSRSPLTRLPNLLHHSSTTLSTPSFSSLSPHHHHHPTSSTTSSSSKLPWSSDKSGEAASSSRHSESRRSVRWSDSRLGKGGSSSSRRSSLYSSKKPLDPRQMWTRYTQTVMPPFQLYEPSLGRFGAWGGGGGRKSRGERRPLTEIDEDGKYVLKMSLPCPKHSECCFCVYSRQLGPVRIYFSNFRTPKLNHGGRYTRRNVGGKEASFLSVDGEKDHGGGEKQQQAKLVLLKEPWMTSSLPSGEVVVPEMSSDVDPHLHPPHIVSKILSGELLADAGKLEENGWRHSHGHLVKEPTKLSLKPTKFRLEPTKFKLEPWLRNSAPPDYPSQASSILASQDYLAKLREPRSVTFWDDDVRTNASSDFFPTVPKNRSSNSLPVKINGKHPTRKKPSNGQIQDKDTVKNLPPIPCRDLAASERLLPKRSSHP